ncbi:MAG: heat-inducible transcriptional repressor HrcA [Thermoanaerobaculia bacterium]
MATRQEPPAEELDPRAREVLREIVMEYIESGEPISSRSLAKSGRFQLSPATLRNAMADLEDLGYVYQPHTSAGRVPTDRGYRYFINNLMKTRRITSMERGAIDEHVARASTLEEAMQLASRMLAKLTDQVGIIFMPTLAHLVMRSMDIISVADRKAMVVIVASNGFVVNKVIDLPAQLGRDELESIGHYITAEFGGLPLQLIHEKLVRLLSQERARYDQLLQNAITVGIEAVEDVLPMEHELFVEGTSSILRKRDYTDADELRKILLALEQKERLVEILNRCLTLDGLQILIGAETPFTQNYNFALIATRYGSGQNPAGMVGILGPTRMEYARMAPLVDYLGRALSRKIEETKQEQS